MRKAIIVFLWFLFWVFLAMPASACGGCVVAGVEMAVFLGATLPVMWTMATMSIIATPESRDSPPPRRHRWIVWTNRVVWIVLILLPTALAAYVWLK